MIVRSELPRKPRLVGEAVDQLPPDALGVRPWLRVPDFLAPGAAAALRGELEHALTYERVEYGELTRVWRAARPVGDPYYGELLREPGASPNELAREALAVFESGWFTSWLSGVAGFEVSYLRPPTPYRLVTGDRVCLHDDMSDPDHAISVAYNLTPGWQPGHGGETTVGRVRGRFTVPTPPDCPMDLHRWEVHPGADVLPPAFNSILILRLSTEFAHSVEPVTGAGPRHSITTIYGRAPFPKEFL